MTEGKKENVDERQSFDKEYNQLVDKSREIEIAQQLLINKAIESDNPADIVKAMNTAKIERNQSSNDRKSTFVDPFEFDASFGYKSAPNKVSYNSLIGMSKTPIINSIIKTRKTQISAFAEPRKDKHSAGFIIRKKGFTSGKEPKLSTADSRRIEELTDFILNTGSGHSWSRPDFDSFLRMFTEDSLVLDQGCFEVVRNRGGDIHEFLNTDGSTMRIADSFSDSDYAGKERKAIGGYYPSFVQVIGSESYAEFYPWEMAFGVRNPSSRIYSNGYGRSELEDMVTLVTAMLWSDQYNRNFFKQGAAPKGILRVKGGANNAMVQDFKQQWKAMVAGVDNAWKTPVIDSESMEWIDLQKGHKDMEYGKWQEYLVKLSCALYTIDPTEIGFAAGSGEGSGGLFESDQSKRIQYSKDKGLKPLLKFIQTYLNKYIISQLAPDLVLEFVGLDAESEKDYLSRLKDEVTHYKTINEIREMEGLKPIKGGDIVLSQTFTSSLMGEEQGAEGAAAGEAAATAAAGEIVPEPSDKGAFEQYMEDNGEDDNAEKAYKFVDHDNNPFAANFMKAINDLENGKL